MSSYKDFEKVADFLEEQSRTSPQSQEKPKDPSVSLSILPAD